MRERFSKAVHSPQHGGEVDARIGERRIEGERTLVMFDRLVRSSRYQRAAEIGVGLGGIGPLIERPAQQPRGILVPLLLDVNEAEIGKGLEMVAGGVQHDLIVPLRLLQIALLVMSDRRLIGRIDRAPLMGRRCDPAELPWSPCPLIVYRYKAKKPPRSAGRQSRKEPVRFDQASGFQPTPACRTGKAEKAEAKQAERCRFRDHAPIDNAVRRVDSEARA